MNIVFLGALVPAERSAQMSGLSIAGNKFQCSLVKYLAEKEDVHIDVLSALPLAPFPREKRVRIKKHHEKLRDNVEYYVIPYVNIPVIKQITQIRGFISCGRQLAKKEPVLLAMNLYPHIGFAFLKLRKKYGVKGAAILADLPIDDNYTRKGAAGLFRKIYNGLTAGIIKKCREFIVLNENAVKEFAAPDSRYIVMEGGIDPEEAEEIKSTGGSGADSGRQEKKRMVYSGALTDYSGVRELMKAMKYMSDKSIVLEIYGDGKLGGAVSEAASESSNIEYCGKVSSREMLKIQSEAWLLVNPRPVEDPIARVTFPSKIFEYMASGTPVLTTKLNGFTHEYYDKMFFTDSNEPSVLAEKIAEIALMDADALKETGRAARKFVLEKKNWRCQTEKIYRFLGEL